ncbi:Ser/Thr phosphatase family protein [Pelomyxa schiedti]|nr:Ser/Thr phosphatase family protein [Pelomyxa schiedti]
MVGVRTITALVALVPLGLCVYSVLTIYPVVRLASLLLEDPPSTAAFWAACACPSLAVLASRLAADFVWPRSLAARGAGRAGMLVFGCVFLALWPCLAYDAAAGSLRLLLPGAGAWLGARERAAGVAIAACAGAAACAGVVKAQLVCVRRFVVPSKKVSRPFTIAHVSDIHVGSRSYSWLSRVVDKVSSLAPDYVVITGDLTDTRGLEPRDLLPLERLTSRIFVTLGNHDFWSGEERVVNALSKLRAKVTVLRNSLSWKGPVQFMGIDDVEYTADFNRIFDALAGLRQFDSSKFTVVLHHRPHNGGIQHVSDSHSVDMFLAGHTHGGQLYPLKFFIKLAFWHISGLLHTDSFFAYTSPGTGTWGPPLRLCDQNTIALFTVTPVE